MSKELERAQALSRDAENKMLDYLLRYSPAQELKVGDIKVIADYTRTLVFLAVNAVEAVPT